MLVPMALAVADVRSLALTLTSPPVAWMCTPAAMVAVLLVTTQLTATEAATPVPPPLLPDWLLAELLADVAPLEPSVPPLDVGSVPVPLFLVFGFEPLTCSLAC